MPENSLKSDKIGKILKENSELLCLIFHFNSVIDCRKYNGRPRILRKSLRGSKPKCISIVPKTLLKRTKTAP